MRVLLLLALAACHAAEGGARDRATTHEVAPPADCVRVAPGESVQAAIDGGAPAVCLLPGTHAGPLRLNRRVTVWGPAEAIVVGHHGTTVSITGEGAQLLGVTVDGEGSSFDALDAGVKITGRDIRVEGVTIVNAAYGLLAEQSERVHIIGNHVRGDRDSAMGLRGDTIRLWQTRDSVIDDNLVEDGRDVVVWYSNHNELRGNRILRGRYGAHFMYSHDNVVTDNELRSGVVGVFVMYSRGLTIRGNTIVDASGVAGMGIGIKESGNIVVDRNLLVHDAVGLYVDTSPLQLGDTLDIRSNSLRLNQTAFVFHASAHRVSVEDNDFADNELNVRVDGGGTAVDVAWRGNYFDDYAGYDLDGDGRGDVAYELRSASGELVGSHQVIALFHGTPALGLVDAASHLDPLFAPELLLSDPSPRMSSSVEVR